MEEILYEHFGNLDSSHGGTDDRLFVLKYNAMRYSSDHFEFCRQFRDDLDQIVTPIKLR